MVNQTTCCPFCDTNVSYQGFGKHLTSARHAEEISNLILQNKLQKLDENMTYLPSFIVKGCTYSVCFGCKKGYKNKVKGHVCNGTAEHCAHLKTLMERRVGDNNPEEEADLVAKLQSDLLVLRQENELLRKENEKLRKERASDREALGLMLEKNPYRNMSDDEFEEIDLDDLSEKQLRLWNAESARRDAEEKVRKAAKREAERAAREAMTEEERRLADEVAAYELKKLYEAQEVREATLKYEEEKGKPKATPLEVAEHDEAPVAEEPVATVVESVVEEVVAEPSRTAPSNAVGGGPVAAAPKPPKQLLVPRAPAAPAPVPVQGPCGMPATLIANTRVRRAPKQVGVLRVPEVAEPVIDDLDAMTMEEMEAQLVKLRAAAAAGMLY